jgi:hypothetical protein
LLFLLFLYIQFLLNDDISLLLDVSILPLDELLRDTIINKSSLADMLSALASSPDLILEASLLSILMCKSTIGVETWVELALCLDMCELAVRVCAASAVAAERHRWVLEGALRVLAVGEELAVLLALVCETGRR